MLVDGDRRSWPVPDGTDTAPLIEGLCPDWPAPAGVHALTTLRSGGVSGPPYQGLNLGDHVGDDPLSVDENRMRLERALTLPASPCWLNQVHGTTVVNAARPDRSGSSPAHCPVMADACYAAQPGLVCAVLTADCLPLLLCDRDGRRVAAIHAGWRGLAAGIIETTVRSMAVPAHDLLVWLGPAIGPAVFEVGPEVRAAFIQYDVAAQQAFQSHGRSGDRNRYLADLYLLARLRLQRLGIESIYGGHWCTYSQPDDFFSFRRDGCTGRMASLIWIA